MVLFWASLSVYHYSITCTQWFRCVMFTCKISCLYFDTTMRCAICISAKERTARPKNINKHTTSSEIRYVLLIFIFMTLFEQMLKVLLMHRYIVLFALSNLSKCQHMLFSSSIQFSLFLTSLLAIFPWHNYIDILNEIRLV